jgi:PIN domain nuclease of toxin-antitoxin system
MILLDTHMLVWLTKSKENHFGDVPQAAGDVARSRW